ncbi:MAG: isoprenylcysteine carboxylmethyltransferase family protein [Pseudohongiellaceae bacterium]
MSLIWARFRFFTIGSTKSRLSSYLYDPVVAVQIISTYYFLLTFNGSSWYAIAGVAVVYLFALAFFWWSIVTANELNFAFSPNAGMVITNGPFALIRHPFYGSYSLVWLSSTLLFNSWVLWITLVYLVAFYFTSAKDEEKVILESSLAKEYRTYSENTGMFLPRIKQWKSWILELSKKKKK